ncbi:transmembrane and death domain protein 1-like isoform X2 [Hemicordylus capensis]|uniref:transmembrane and death domain protein 1-like isoform X2 n=1 Tax=Hemicordylus capensis TaxID=884348 RepID=UPI0023045358|nr:transmembrane and death domain protein 1-like isoform X2 [Hemicordylus capensis]
MVNKKPSGCCSFISTLDVEHAQKVSRPRSLAMLTVIGIALFVLAQPASCDDTVADNIGSHMMGRLSELLSPEECQAFYSEITGPEENMEKELEQLSEKNNPIHARRRRDITSMHQCKKTLSHWLDTEGDTMYWDRLSRALQAIGRSDVSMELGKNLNQDKNLEMKKNVEKYHETVKHLTSSLLLEENEVSESEDSGQGRLRRDGDQPETELKPEELDDFELIIERESLPPYKQSLFGWFTPLATGVISGFLSSFVVAALAVLSLCWIVKQGFQDPMVQGQGSVPEMIFHYPPRRGGIYYMHQEFEERRMNVSEIVNADEDEGEGEGGSDGEVEGEDEEGTDG